MEWEEVTTHDENASASDHADWCSEQNFGVSNFGLHPQCLPISLIRHDAGLHMECAIVRKALLVLRQCLDCQSENTVMFDFFDELWQNTCYSNQFRHRETCSCIDGSHISRFVANCDKLLQLIKNECED